MGTDGYLTRNNPISRQFLFNNTNYYETLVACIVINIFVITQNNGYRFILWHKTNQNRTHSRSDCRINLFKELRLRSDKFIYNACVASNVQSHAKIAVGAFVVHLSQ